MNCVFQKKPPFHAVKLVLVGGRDKWIPKSYSSHAIFKKNRTVINDDQFRYVIFFVPFNIMELSLRVYL